MAISKSNRVFRIWDFNVNHNQLLIRSPKKGADTRNVDIAFVGVKYIELPTSLDGIRLDSPSSIEIDAIKEKLATIVERDDIYVLVSSEQRFYVVAAGFKMWENELDIFQTSLESF